MKSLFLIAAIADSVISQVVATFGTIVVAVLGLLAQHKWRRARKRAGKTPRSGTRVIIYATIAVGVLASAAVIWFPHMSDRQVFYLAIGVQGGLVVALLLGGWHVSEWTRETREGRIAANRQVRSNQNVVDWFAKHTGTSPAPLPSEDDEELSA